MSILGFLKNYTNFFLKGYVKLDCKLFAKANAEYISFGGIQVLISLIAGILLSFDWLAREALI